MMKHSPRWPGVLQRPRAAGRSRPPPRPPDAASRRCPLRVPYRALRCWAGSLARVACTLMELRAVAIQMLLTVALWVVAVLRRLPRVELDIAHGALLTRKSPRPRNTLHKRPGALPVAQALPATGRARQHLGRGDARRAWRSCHRQATAACSLLPDQRQVHPTERARARIEQRCLPGATLLRNVGGDWRCVRRWCRVSGRICAGARGISTRTGTRCPRCCRDHSRGSRPGRWCCHCPGGSGPSAGA